MPAALQSSSIKKLCFRRIEAFPHSAVSIMTTGALRKVWMAKVATTRRCFQPFAIKSISDRMEREVWRRSAREAHRVAC
jgi:hypothetical protein